MAETTSTRIAPHSDDGLLRLHDIRHYLLNVVPESGLAPGEKASIEAVRVSP